MYQPEEYRKVFMTSDSDAPFEDLIRGAWSPASKHPGENNAGMRRYGASKLCEVMMMQELSLRIPQTPELANIMVLGVDPGGMASDLTRRSGWFFTIVKILMPIFKPLLYLMPANGTFRTLDKSASDVLQAGFADEKELLSLGDEKLIGPRKGKGRNAGLQGLYLDGSYVKSTGEEPMEREKTERLWRAGVKLAGVKEGDSVLA